jgi:hypothetical protein
MPKASSHAPIPVLPEDDIASCRASQKPSEVSEKAQTQSGREPSVRDELLAIVRNQ